MAVASWVTSAPAASQTSAMALMNEIFVARKEFAATLTSSAVGKSVTRNGTPSAMIGAYTSRRRSSALVERTPTTRRSGCRVSSTAKPSRRNSGFHATSTPSAEVAASRSASSAAVPTGTVDLPTTRAPGRRWGANEVTEPNTWDMSAFCAPAVCGVPTQMKCTSANCATSSNEVVKRTRPASMFRARTSSSPGS